MELSSASSAQRMEKLALQNSFILRIFAENKAKILSHFDQACQEYQQIKLGKKNAISKKELLNDL